MTQTCKVKLFDLRTGLGEAVDDFDPITHTNQCKEQSKNGKSDPSTISEVEGGLFESTRKPFFVTFVPLSLLTDMIGSRGEDGSKRSAIFIPPETRISS